MEPFDLHCPTCRAKLRVSTPKAIGRIVSCPRCESMVEVTAPAGWTPPAVAPSPQPSEPSSTPTTANAESGATAAPRSTDDSPATDEREYAEGIPLEAAQPAWGDISLEQRARRVLWWVTPPLGLVIVAAALYGIFGRGGAPPAIDEATANVVPTDAAPAAAPIELAPRTGMVDERWLPTGATFALSLELGAITADEAPQLAAGLGLWPAQLPALLETFELSPPELRRMTWLGSNAQQWETESLIVIQTSRSLSENAAWWSTADPLEMQIAGRPVRMLNGSQWKHPVVLVDRHTLITGPLAWLENVSERAAPLMATDGAAAALVALPGECVIIAQTSSALVTENERWPLPAGWLGAWSGGAPPWDDLLQESRLWVAGLDKRPVPMEPAAGEEAVESTADEQPSPATDEIEATIEAEANPSTELATDEQWTLTLQVLGPAGRHHPITSLLTQVLQQAQDTLAQRADIATHTDNGDENAGASEFASLALSLFSSAKITTTTDGAMWQAVLDEHAPRLAQAAQAAWEQVQLQIATRQGVRHQQQVVRGLLEFTQQQGAFPAGAGGAPQLPPETRLSWIAELLPYYEQPQWREQLSFAHAWNSQHNRPVTTRVLPPMLNPAIAQTHAGDFPVTHFVGAGGVGADAASLPADAPAAGVFGYDRRLKREALADGASQTIALFGVQEQLGAWASGGPATVRSLTTRPYINGPDGLGTGQPDGMFVGMADGSVRFLHADIAPEILEQLTTANGARRVPVTIIDQFPATAPSGRIEQVEAPVTAATADDDTTPAAEGDAATLPATEAPAVEDDVAANEALAALLARQLPRVQMQNVPLQNLLDLVEQMTGATVNVDLNSLVEVGVDPQAPISLELTNTTLAEVLKAGLAQRELAYTLQNGELFVASLAAQRNMQRPVRYRVNDLSTATPLETLAEWTRTLLSSGSMAADDDPFHVAPSGDSLLITADEATHAQLVSLFEKLRLARGFPLRATGAARPEQLTSRWDAATELLLTPVTANFPHGAPLRRVLSGLQQSTGANLLIDEPALESLGLSANEPVTIAARNLPLGDVLEQLTANLTLAFRVLDANTLEVTTPAAIAGHPEIELYQLPLSMADTVDWPQRLRAELAEQFGEAPLTAIVDPVSRYLIVRAAQPVQRAVARSLVAEAGPEPTDSSALTPP